MRIPIRIFNPADRNPPHPIAAEPMQNGAGLSRFLQFFSTLESQNPLLEIMTNPIVSIKNILYN